MSTSAGRQKKVVRLPTLRRLYECRARALTIDTQGMCTSRTTIGARIAGPRAPVPAKPGVHGVSAFGAILRQRR